MRSTLRFLVLALPVAALVLGAVDATAAALGLAPDTAPLAARGVARVAPLGRGLELAAILFEATALVAFYLLVARPGRSPLLDGLAAGFAAWLFRGPLLVLAVATLTRLPTEPFWQLARVGLASLPAAGLAIGAVARLRPLPP
jgi:hypothetical protein